MTEENRHVFVSAKSDVGDATLVRPSNWNAQHRTGMIMTNKSGGQVTANMVCVLNATADDSFTTSAVGITRRTVVVAQETIADNASGLVKYSGFATINVQDAVARGDYLTLSSTAGAAKSGGASTGDPGSVVERVNGVFGIALTGFAGPGAGTVLAYLYGHTVGEPWNADPTGAGIPYVVTALSGTLAGERRLQVSNDLTLTDGGANGNITVALNSTYGTILSTFQRILAQGNPGVNFVNSAAEQNVLVQTIAANALGTLKGVRMNVYGKYLNGSGAQQQATIRVYYGVSLAVALVIDLDSQPTPGNIYYGTRFEATLAGNGATNAQVLTLEALADLSDSTYNGFNGVHHRTSPGTVAIDSTVNQDMKITIQLSAANANLGWQSWRATLEYMP